jgi:hypothetical protein
MRTLKQEERERELWENQTKIGNTEEIKEIQTHNAQHSTR